MTVSKIVNRFNQHGTVNDRPRSGRPVTVTTEDKQMDVAMLIIEDPHTSIRKFHQQHNSFGSMQNILTKKLKFHPCKVRLVYQMDEDDPDRHLEFPEVMMTRMNADANLLKRIVFSDESFSKWKR